MTEKIIPDGYKLVAVKGLDELVYWLERCKDKGHLENCADLIEPFEAFEYRNVSEEAVIAAHETKAAPAVPHGEPDVWVREQRGTYEGVETLDPMFVFGSTNPGPGRHGATYSPRYPAAPSQETALTGCNCRWDGDKQVEWCELHLAHKDAIHEWAERAKTAEAKLAQLSTAQEPVTLTDDEINFIWSDGPPGSVLTPWGIAKIRAIIAALREKEGK